jgi:uracil-DNA glycosylase family 4
VSAPVPPSDCSRCERLAAFREINAQTHPDWHNAPVTSFGAETARLLIVGLAPGMKGANRTGRPFTGDFAGGLLYAGLLRHGFASGQYNASPDDGLQLVDCRITNAVRCLPPQNKPLGAEITACRDYLVAEIAAMVQLETILALGRVAHESVLTALGRRRAQTPFGHGAVHALDGLTLVDSYHCSRYNTQTRRLTPEMFYTVIAALRARLDQPI